MRTAINSAKIIGISARTSDIALKTIKAVFFMFRILRYLANAEFSATSAEMAGGRLTAQIEYIGVNTVYALWKYPIPAPPKRLVSGILKMSPAIRDTTTESIRTNELTSNPCFFNNTSPSKGVLYHSI